MAFSYSNVARAVGSVVSLFDARPAWRLPGKLDTSSAADMYQVLRAYYLSNGLYDQLSDLLRREGVVKENLKPLRNPTFRSVEFFAAHIWPGVLPDALPIKMLKAKRPRVTESQTEAPAAEAIRQVWRWSNWGATKQVGARQLSLYGDMFIKVCTTPDATRVYFQLLEPEHVTDFDVDERDYVIYARIDVPQSRRRADGTTEWFTHTERWSRDDNSYTLWEHDQGSASDFNQLGQPTDRRTLDSFGISFVPISHGKFQDIGELRGWSALGPALDKIDEANRMATRLHGQLWRHNDVTWALTGGSDATGRPLPAPQINPTDAVNPQTSGYVTLGEENFIGLPGNSSLESLVPNLNYAAALDILNAHMRELRRDLPELAAYELAEESPDLSGRAVRMLMGPAISRTLEARGNAEAALIRADQMALTIGQFHGLFLKSLGTFEKGSFEHQFEPRDVLPSDALETAQEQQAAGLALKAWVDSGVPIEVALVELFDWPEDKVAKFTKDRMAAIEREQKLAQDDMQVQADIQAEAAVRNQPPGGD